MSSEKTDIYSLWRALTEMKLSPAGVSAIAEIYDDSFELYDDRERASMLLSLHDLTIFQDSDLEEAKRLSELCEEAGISVIFRGSGEYPVRLMRLAEPPPALFVSGRLPSLEPAVSVVGSRDASEEALDVARSFSEELADEGACIISGLARGVDLAAHFGAVDSLGGRTVAVVASGTLPLLTGCGREIWEMVESRGAIVSEYPPDEPPKKQNFLRRNRITAALSDVLFIPQASLRSGTLNTARVAGEIGVPVYVWQPPEAAGPEFDGSRRLIKNGAFCVTSPMEIISGLL